MALPTIDEAKYDSETLNGADSRNPSRAESDADTLGDDRNDSTFSEFRKYGSRHPGEDNTAEGSMRDLKDRDNKRMHLKQIKAGSVWKGFNPTVARFRIHWRHDEYGSHGSNRTRGGPLVKQNAGDEVDMRWSSRYNRKGRNSFVVHRSGSIDHNSPSNRLRRAKLNTIRLCKNIFHMFFSFPYWDMAFWSGWAYSWGSVLFVIDGAFGWTPIAWPYTKFKGEDDAVGFLFFFGALLYEVGAAVAYLEAINEGSFHGSAMKKFLEGREDDQKKLLDQKLGAFFGHLVPHPSISRQKRKRRQMGRLANAVDVEGIWNPDLPLEKPVSYTSQRRGGVDFGTTSPEEEADTAEYLPWRWWPTWQNFKNHHVREIGWWACSIQLFGATLYGITGIVALPGILDHLAQWQENAAYWIPQMVASACFLTASILFTLETQEKWYKPELKVLGWWVGFWACVGSCGFLLCACLGPAYGNSGAQYQSALSSLWGSAAYLLSGLLQWYEAVNKHPIEELLNEPGVMKSFQVHPV